VWVTSCSFRLHQSVFSDPISRNVIASRMPTCRLRLKPVTLKIYKVIMHPRKENDKHMVIESIMFSTSERSTFVTQWTFIVVARNNRML
jgi:hypothetical protein